MTGVQTCALPICFPVTIKKDAESDEVIITVGNHLATEQVFQSEEEAQKVIDATDWNLVAALIYACKEADRWGEEQKSNNKKEEK